MAEDMKLTPGGFRHKSLVHFIEPGHVLDGTGGRMRKLDPSGQVVADFGPITLRPDKGPLTPENAVGLQEKVPEKVRTYGDKWIAWALWINESYPPVSSFTTTWIVPRAPATQSGQTISLFSGIQNSTSMMIYQPVLQWGETYAGGGSYWAVATWCVVSGLPRFISHLTPVNPGDVLVGEITLTGQSTGPSGNLFSYNCQFQGIPNSGYPLQNVEELRQCVETLEAYNITKCSDYPATDGVLFWRISIQTGTIPSSMTPKLDWRPNNRITDCQQHVVVLSNANPGSKVLIYNRQADPLSVRNFLVTHGTDPSEGVLKFIQEHHPGISSLRALLEL